MDPRGRRLALLIACSEFPRDGELTQLPSCTTDANKLSCVLGDSEIGGFEVDVLENAESSDMLSSIDDLCNKARDDDLLLLYYSGHGILDDDGRLYLAGTNTTRPSNALAVPIHIINDTMDSSPSKNQILILDCCYAGAYGSKLNFRGSSSRVVLTATGRLHVAYVGREGEPSVFTGFLIEGLKTGDADLDGDGLVSCDDIYHYLNKRMSVLEPLQIPGRFYFLHRRLHIARSPRGPVRDTDTPRCPILVDKTWPEIYGPLYDRRECLEDIHRTFSAGDVRRIWITGEDCWGKTAFVRNLVDQCLEEKTFDDCIYFTRDSSRYQAGVTYPAFVYEKLAEAGLKAKRRILLVVDDFDLLPRSTREQILHFLSADLREGWGAIVVGQPNGIHDHWHTIDLMSRLDQSDLEEFVNDYIGEKSKSKSKEDHHRERVQEALEQFGGEWARKLDEATKGDVRRLLAALERLEQGESFDDVLEWLRGLLGSDDPIRIGVMEAIDYLKRDHLRLLRLLSLFESSASLEMLESILQLNPDEVESLLKDVAASGALLVEILSVEGEVGETRYRVNPRKKKYIRQLERCTQFDEELVREFTHWWRVEFAKKHQNRYSVLSKEHQNLMGVLDLLWERTRVVASDDQNRNEDNPLPLDSFSIQNRQAGREYISMRDYLRNYLNDEVRWLEYRRSAERGYALACAKDRLDKAIEMALDVANTYCREGYYCYSPTDLRMARNWVTRANEAFVEGEFSGYFARTQRSDIFRTQGVIAMRRYTGRCSYQESCISFEAALAELRKMPEGEADKASRIQGVNCYLAQLEMRYALRSEKAKEDLDRFIESSSAEARASAVDYKECSSVEREFERVEAVLTMTLAELRIWWGDWGNAAKALEKALPLSYKLGRKDLLAEGLYLQALVYQESSSRDESYGLDRAINEGRKALALWESLPASENFVKLCGTHLLLAGIYFCKKEKTQDPKDHQHYQDHLDKAQNLLELHGAFLTGAETGLDPDAIYQKGCERILSGRFEEADDLLLAAVQVQPGLAYRAWNDFRLHPPIVPGGREWRCWRDLPPRIIGHP